MRVLIQRFPAQELEREDRDCCWVWTPPLDLENKAGDEIAPSLKEIASLGKLLSVALPPSGRLGRRLCGGRG